MEQKPLGGKLGVGVNFAKVRLVGTANHAMSIAAQN
jgi:hypothetical protein